MRPDLPISGYKKIYMFMYIMSKTNYYQYNVNLGVKKHIHGEKLLFAIRPLCDQFFTCKTTNVLPSMASLYVQVKGVAK